MTGRGWHVGQQVEYGARGGLDAEFVAEINMDVDSHACSRRVAVQGFSSCILSQPARAGACRCTGCKCWSTNSASVVRDCEQGLLAMARAGHDAAQQSLAIHRLDVMFARELQGFRGVG